MKGIYSAILSHLSNAIYRQIYKENYAISKSDKLVISPRVHDDNTRALELAFRKKQHQVRIGDYCAFTLNATVTQLDSENNKLALKIACLHENPISR